MDEHFLAEDLTLDGSIGAADAFYACRQEDYPKDKHEDWEYLVEKFDFEANQDPDFVREYSAQRSLLRNLLRIGWMQSGLSTVTSSVIRRLQSSVSR